MSLEYKGDGAWAERPHKDAALQLLKDAGRGLPRFYLQSLVKHPGLTTMFTLESLGWGLILVGQKDIGSEILLAGLVPPYIGLAADAVQIGANLWNEYRKGIHQEPAVDFVSRIAKFRNFL